MPAVAVSVCLAPGGYLRCQKRAIPKLIPELLNDVRDALSRPSAIVKRTHELTKRPLLDRLEGGHSVSKLWEELEQFVIATILNGASNDVRRCAERTG